MKKALWILPLLMFIAVTFVSAGDEKADIKAMKQKLSQKIEIMKANGASQEEIDKLVADFKKKLASMQSGQKVETTKVAALKAEAKKRGISERTLEELTPPRASLRVET